MKRIVFVVTVGLLAMVILFVGCATKTSQHQHQKMPTQNVTGELKYLSVPLEGGNATVTVETPQGRQTFQLTANTTYSINGQPCKLEDIGRALADGNTTYTCALVYEECAPVNELAIYIDKKTEEYGIIDGRIVK